MNELGLLLLTAVLAAVVARARLSVAFTTLVATVLLVPAPLVVPNGFSPVPTVVRVVLWVFALRLIVDAVRRTRPSLREFTAGPVTAALGLLTATGAIVGVALAPPTALTWSGALQWLGTVDQFVFLAVALASIRRLGTRRSLQLLSIAAGLMAAIAVWEQLTGNSWGAFLFSGVPEQFTEAARQLGVRGGENRVRVGAEFPLEYGWIALALTPPLLLEATRSWRSTWPALVAAIIPLSVVWSVTRSASVALIPVVVLTALLARGRQLHKLVLVLVLGAAVVVLLDPGMLDPLTPQADVGAIDVRTERLPVILELAAEEPVLGLGLAGLSALGFATTDSAYLLTYAEQGVLGLALLAVALLTALAALGRGVWHRGPQTAVAGACLAGAAGLVASGFAFDTFTTLGSAHVFWLLVALGLVAAEELAGPTPFPTMGRVRFALPVAGLVVASVLATLYPVTHGGSYLMAMVPPLTEAVGEGDPQEQNETIVSSVCGIAERVAADHGAGVWCRELPRAAGVAQLRIEAGRAESVAETADATLAAVRSALRAPEVRLLEDDTVFGERPTAVATAPVWLPLGALGLALLLPSPWRRDDPRSRRRLPHPDHGPVEVTA